MKTPNPFRLVFCFIIFMALGHITKAATCVAIASNDWSLPATWSCGRPPACGDSLVIPAGITVTIEDVLDYSSCFPQTLDVTIAGTLNFQTGKKLYLPCNSQLTVLAGGQVTAGGGGGNSNLISICNVTVWNTAAGTLSGPVSLPVELISFNGVQKNNSILLSWATATEIENDFFTIEKSKDGGNFSTIGTVKGNGNSQIRRDYTFVDQLPNKGINYYRLKQTDFDNDQTYLKIIAVQFEGKYDLNFYPNPKSINEGLNLELKGFEGHETEILIMDVLGRIIYNNFVKISEEEVKMSINSMNNFGTGVYTLIVKNPAITINQKLIIQ